MIFIPRWKSVMCADLFLLLVILRVGLIHIYWENSILDLLASDLPLWKSRFFICLITALYSFKMTITKCLGYYNKWEFSFKIFKLFASIVVWYLCKCHSWYKHVHCNCRFVSPVIDVLLLFCIVMTFEVTCPSG